MKRAMRRAEVGMPWRQTAKAAEEAKAASAALDDERGGNGLRNRTEARRDGATGARA